MVTLLLLACQCPYRETILFYTIHKEELKMAAKTVSMPLSGNDPFLPYTDEAGCPPEHVSMPLSGNDPFLRLRRTEGKTLIWCQCPYRETILFYIYQSLRR